MIAERLSREVRSICRMKQTGIRSRSAEAVTRQSRNSPIFRKPKPTRASSAISAPLNSGTKANSKNTPIAWSMRPAPPRKFNYALQREIFPAEVWHNRIYCILSVIHSRPSRTERSRFFAVHCSIPPQLCLIFHPDISILYWNGCWWSRSGMDICGNFHDIVSRIYRIFYRSTHRFLDTENT